MAITRELDNLKKLESVGFSHEQAETLADVIEKSHVDSQESLKEFFSNELSKQIGSLDSKLSKEINNLRVEISNLRVEISRELKDLLIKIFGIIVGTVGIAVTILKLFP